ncbi:MAG: hypothetical protein VYB61_03775, partial [Verrucomicrobiota bacterium]|nr:hypothetical protein [Verrucomicrobiota bacterium]
LLVWLGGGSLLVLRGGGSLLVLRGAGSLLVWLGGGSLLVLLGGCFWYCQLLAAMRAINHMTGKGGVKTRFSVAMRATQRHPVSILIRHGI